MRRKLLSFILTLVMVLGLIPGGSIVSKADTTYTFNKVTSSADLTSGTYLIVYEEESVAFKGSLSSLDAVGNTIAVTVSNSTIALADLNDTFTIDTTAGTIKSASGKFIGNASNSNGLTSSNTALTNTLSIDNDGNADVKSSGGAYLRYNAASNQTRFRYYKSATYTQQKSIQLYKLVESGSSTHAHSFGSWTSNNDGTHSRTCTASGCTLPNSKETGSCTYGEGVPTTAADCIHSGVMTYTCSLCGYSYTETIEPTGVHVDEDGDDVCDNCGADMPEQQVFTLVTSLQEGDQVVIVNHANSIALSSEKSGNYNKGVSVSPSNGQLIDPSDDLIFTVSVLPSGIEFTHGTDGKLSMGTSYSSFQWNEVNNIWTISNSATENAVYILNVGRNVYMEWYKSNSYWSGYKTITEELFAQDLYVLRSTSSHTHTWNDGVVTTEPTCGAEGVKTYTCTECNETMTEAIPATGIHVDGDNDGYCDVCHAEVESAESVVRRAYALEQGASLTGTYILSGRITEVVTAYNAQFGDITVNMAVTGADEPNIIQCYQLKASSVAGMSDAIPILAVGDDIMVRGTIKNYNGTIEFNKSCELLAFTDNTIHVHNYSWDHNVGTNGKHTLICANSDGLCESVSVQEDCTYGEVETIPATCVQEGSQIKTCTVCGYVRTVATLPATGIHTDANNDGICDDCGATFNRLFIGDEVVLISKDALMELSAISTTSTKYGVGTGYTDSPAGLMKLTVEAGSEGDTFAFLSDDGYLTWTSGNSLNVAEEKSINTSWKVTIDDDGNATILNAADEARQIWWNVGSPRFACYTGKTAGTAYYNVQFYKLASAPTITGRNAELKADLTVNIYADIDATKYPGAKMVVTIDGTDEKTIALPAAPEADGKYKFSYDGVIPSQMNDEIVASLQAADGTELDSKTFTLKSYLDAIPGSAEYAAYSADKKAAMDALIDDLLVYGREAQIKFEHNTDKLIVDASYTGSGRTSTENALTMTPNITSQADAVAAEHGYFKNVNVIHENQNWVRVLYTDKDKDGETTFTMQMGDGTPVAMTLDGGYLCTDGIAPMDYGTVMTFKAIRDGNPIATITYSVYTYCTRKGGNAFVDALYNYGVSAAAFAALD